MKLPAPYSDEAKEPRRFTPEEEEQKRLFYDKMAPRRRKFIDRIGFDNWDPFEAPKEPMDIRVDNTGRTIQQLVNEFLKSPLAEQKEGEFARGALECAFGLVNKEEKWRGTFAFSLWYHQLLEKENTQDEKRIR